MRYLGIDFGTRRIGLALSDGAGDFSYPHSVIKNDKYALGAVLDLLKKEEVGALVMGESRDFSGKENGIFADARLFGEELSQRSALPLFWEPEFLTSAEAEHIQGKGEMLDASAAALILKSYLSRTKRG